MKRIIFVLAILATFFTGCSWFDSKPINPKIIGVSYLQYDARLGNHYCVVDSTRYIVSEVTIPDKSSRSSSAPQQMAAVEGMKITIFTTQYRSGVQAVAGEQTEAQIEEIYKENYTFNIVFWGLIIIWFILLILSKIKQ
ncbi:MAG: hypothetical protein J6T72_02095 [Alphaproteobacteria bacterium]|nr:hypothetical protein [Alphaproteobacteria bacterium]